MSRLDPWMSDEEFAELGEIIRARTGIEIQRTRRFAIGARAIRRAGEIGLRSIAEYLKYLRMAPQRLDELDELLRRCGFSETRFFRYPGQFDWLEREWLPRLIDRRAGVRSIRIWSAGCSTGQEAYSLAITVARVLGVRLPDWDVRILGTDISERSLQSANRAVYSSFELRGLDPAVFAAHFEPADDGFGVRKPIRSLVGFRYHNLRDALAARRLGVFDLVLCRNVLCHFGLRSRDAALDVLAEALADDGLLLAGHRDGAGLKDLGLTPVGEPGSMAWRFQAGAEADQSWRSATIGSCRAATIAG